MNILFQLFHDQATDSLVKEFINTVVRVSRNVVKIKNKLFSNEKQNCTIQIKAKMV